MQAFEVVCDCVNFAAIIGSKVAVLWYVVPNRGCEEVFIGCREILTFKLIGTSVVIKLHKLHL
jgi:hypothetical protein